MDSRLGNLQIVAAWLILLAASACAPTATPAPALLAPTATQPATAMATATALPELTTPPTAVPAPTVVIEPSARYLLTFEATWSQATHPTDFPPNPHFSGLIGATHSDNVHLWAEGEIATPGMKNMAETGKKTPLDEEIGVLIAGGEACEIISGGGIPRSPGAVTVAFTVTQDCPLVSVVSMIAPSPDWFVGVTGLRLLGDTGWIEEQVVDLYPYDANTDSGESYTSPDEPTGASEGIHRIATGPLRVDDQVLPLGVFRLTRLNQ